MAVGEGGGIEFGCFAGFPLVEPQAGNHLLGHVALSSQVFKTHRKFGSSRSSANEERLRPASSTLRLRFWSLHQSEVSVLIVRGLQDARASGYVHGRQKYFTASFNHT